MDVLRTEALGIGYTRPLHVVADNLQLKLQQGELVCLLGPNGAGKSTLMRTLAAMQAPLSGHVYLQGDDVFRLSPRQRAQRLSIVLTERLDVGLLTGYDLVALGRHPYTNALGQLSSHDQNVVRWAVEAVNATHLAGRMVNDLSDGERQKIMIARALAQEPDLILLDEPTAFLDLPRRFETMQLLRQLAEKMQRAILLSTHDLDLALRSAHRLWLMDNQGHIRSGAPEDLVLNGAFQETFASSGVIFDAETGSFRLRGQNHHFVQVSGEGLALEWTKRALQREGFGITTQAQIHIEVGAQDWRVLSEEQSIELGSIYALMAFLKKATQTPD